jgi:hypothetical protein
MPNLGIVASSINKTSTGNYYSIATITSQTSSVGTFTNIPQTYKHLQIRALNHNSASSLGEICVRLGTNATAVISTTSYSYHRIDGSGSGAFAANGSSVTYMSCAYCPSTAISSTIMGVIVIDILDYTSSTKNKTIRSIGGYDANGSGQSSFSSGLLNVTGAIQSVSVFSSSGGTSANNTFALYGIN